MVSDTLKMSLSHDLREATATNTSSITQSVGLRGGRRRSSGKFYYEIGVVSKTNDTGNLGASGVESSLASKFGTDKAYITTATGGSVYVAGTSTTGFEVGVSSRAGFALDLDTGRAWINVNGTWVSNNSPSNSTGTFPGTTLSSGTYAPFFIADIAPGVIITVRLYSRQSELLSLPAGFNSWT